MQFCLPGWWRSALTKQKTNIQLWILSGSKVQANRSIVWKNGPVNKTASFHFVCFAGSFFFVAFRLLFVHLKGEIIWVNWILLIKERINKPVGKYQKRLNQFTGTTETRLVENAIKMIPWSSSSNEQIKRANANVHTKVIIPNQKKNELNSLFLLHSWLSKEFCVCFSCRNRLNGKRNIKFMRRKI